MSSLGATSTSSYTTSQYDQYLFFGRTIHAHDLKSIIEVTKDISEYADIIVCNDGLKLIAINGSLTSWIRIKMEFTEYIYNSGQHICIVVSDTYKMIKSISANDIVNIYMYKNDNCYLFIRVEDEGEGKVTEYSIKLREPSLQNQMEQLEMQSNLQYNNFLQMKSVMLSRLIRDMINIGNDNIEILYSKNKITFICQCDIGRQKTI